MVIGLFLNIYFYCDPVVQSNTAFSLLQVTDHVYHKEARPPSIIVTNKIVRSHLVFTIATRNWLGMYWHLLNFHASKGLQPNEYFLVMGKDDLYKMFNILRQISYKHVKCQVVV